MYPSEAKIVYAEKHEELWIEFVEIAVERAGYSELKETPGLSKADFAEEIRHAGLWNVNHVDEAYDPDCLDVFAKYINQV